MAILWVQAAGRGDGRWTAESLDGERLCLGTDTGLRRALPEESSSAGALLVRRADGDRGFALIADDVVSINGVPLAAGIAVLCDRDEIRGADGARFYYRREGLPVVEPYPGGAAGARCARCNDILVAGEDAVRCVGCGGWFMQTAEAPCFEYGETCPNCSAPTRLDAGFEWTPDL